MLLLTSGQIWWQQYRLIIHRPLNQGLALLSIWLVITACFAHNQTEAFIGLFNFLPYFFVFAAYSVLIQTPTQLRQCAWLLVVTSMPVVLIGLGQLFWGWAGHFQFLWIVFDWLIAPKGEPPGRMASAFMHANILAAYLLIVFSLALGLWIDTYHLVLPVKKRAGHLYRLSLTTWLRWGFLSVVVIGHLVALILTDSRNAWAIAVVTSLAFALYQGWRWLLAGVTGVAGSILCAAFGPSPMQQWLRVVIPAFFWARLTDQLFPNRPQALLRITQWQFAWSLTQRRPWLGWGLRNFSSLYEAQMHVSFNHPHNLLLMLAVETGIPFTILFCGWVVWAIVPSLQLWRNWQVIAPASGQMLQDRLIFFSYLIAVLACVLFNTVDVTVFDARVNSLGWLLLAAICGVVYNRQIGSNSHYS